MKKEAVEAPGVRFVQSLLDGRFLLQRSRLTGRVIYYPRVAEPKSGSSDLEWIEVSGRGLVYSTTVIRQRPPQADENLALVDLEEGVRLLSRVEGIAPADVAIGMKVRARIVQSSGDPLIVFLPTE